MFRDDEWEGWDWEHSRIGILGREFDSIRRMENGDFYLFFRFHEHGPDGPVTRLKLCRLNIDDKGARGFKVQHLGEEECMRIEVALAPKEEEEEE